MGKVRKTKVFLPVQKTKECHIICKKRPNIGKKTTLDDRHPRNINENDLNNTSAKQRAEGQQNTAQKKNGGNAVVAGKFVQKYLDPAKMLQMTPWYTLFCLNTIFDMAVTGS